MRLLKDDERDLALGENLLVELDEDDVALANLCELENRVLEHQAACTAMSEEILDGILLQRQRSLNMRREVFDWLRERGHSQLHPEFELYLTGALAKLVDDHKQRKASRNCAACGKQHIGRCLEALG